MPGIRGAREELARLKLQLAELETKEPPADLAEVRRRARLERQMLTLEEAVLRHDGGRSAAEPAPPGMA